MEKINLNKKKKEKEYSTIVIVNKNNPDTKSITIASKHIYNFKYYLIIIFLMISILSSLLLIFGKKLYENYNARLELELYKKQVLEPMISDTIVARSYIKQIDKQLETLNLYLKKRGLKSKIKAGGVEIKNLGSVESFKYYNIYLKSLLNNLKYIPIGYPHYNKYGSGYGYRRNPFSGQGSEFHSGIDFEGKVGDIVRATASGIVTTSSYHFGYGQCVIIKHKNGYETLYGHLSKINVRLGQKVKSNQKIGELGSTGRSTGPHIHYEVRYLGKPINPTMFLELNQK